MPNYYTSIYDGIWVGLGDGWNRLTSGPVFGTWAGNR